MTYHYARIEDEANRYLAGEIKKGYRGYVLALSANNFEIRTWK